MLTYEKASLKKTRYHGYPHSEQATAGTTSNTLPGVCGGILRFGTEVFEVYRTFSKPALVPLGSGTSSNIVVTPYCRGVGGVGKKPSGFDSCCRLSKERFLETIAHPVDRIKHEPRLCFHRALGAQHLNLIVGRLCSRGCLTYFLRLLFVHTLFTSISKISTKYIFFRRNLNAPVPPDESVASAAMHRREMGWSPKITELP